nr:RNA-directed DNA polymerase, eukaryota, reverse transcriptase zinc-binding domain protein [Tanacetum cinerariifolium]
MVIGKDKIIQKSYAVKLSIKNRLAEDKIIDQGRSNDEIVNERSKLLKELLEFNTSTSSDLAQKANIRWALKVMKTLNTFMELLIRCALNWLSVGYWKLIDQDVVDAILLFFSPGSFPHGCNSSFLALIPKTQDAKLVKYFRPISLIDSMYKIITKILANQLSLVISDLVSDVQSAFLSNRQILDGPFIFNELLSWCKYKKYKAMIFKVDFEKTFDLAIYGVQGALDSSRNFSKRSPWIDIICEFRTLANKGIDLQSLVKKKVDNGELTSFWDAIWLADSPLKALPLCGGIAEEQVKMLIESTSSIVLPQISDRWIWRLDSLGDFSVKSACCFIKDSLFPKVESLSLCGIDIPQFYVLFVVLLWSPLRIFSSLALSSSINAQGCSMVEIRGS